MSKPPFKIMKVFDCQDMPKEIRKALFDYFERANDTYIEWQLGEMPEGPITDWLLAHGAEKDEEVLVQYWW